MRYAKLNNNYPSYAPNPIHIGNRWWCNPPGSVYEAEGYKPVRFTEPPTEPGNGWWKETWSETEDAIVQGWEWHETTDEDEISPEEAIEILMGGGEE